MLYAAVTTRIDIAFAVSRLARFLTNPGPEHHAAADRVLSYLKRHRGLGLQLGGGDHFTVASDASFADNTLDRKSSQAYVMTLSGGVIGWRVNKQNTVTTSTTEAELLALSQASKEGLYIKRLLDKLTIELDDHRIRIECDNTQTIRLVNEEISRLRTKLRHVDIHNHWVRQEAREGRIAVDYTPTRQMIANGLTKSLPPSEFENFLKQVNLIDITSKITERRTEDLQQSDLDFESLLGIENYWSSFSAGSAGGVCVCVCLFIVFKQPWGRIGRKSATMACLLMYTFFYHEHWRRLPPRRTCSPGRKHCYI